MAIPTMMDALVKTEPGKGLVLKQVPVPEVGAGEVLIKIHKTAICGTDVHIYNWDPWSQQHVTPPNIIGHEYVGEIAALGAGVNEFSIGQRVSGSAATAAPATSTGANTQRVSALNARAPLPSTCAFRPPTWCPFPKACLKISSPFSTPTAMPRTRR